MTRNYSWHRLIRNVMDMCWEWVEHRKYSAVEIYDVFADEDDALVFIEHYPGVVDNPALKSLFFCIFDGICYVIWKAYQTEQDYFPPMLESESDQSIELFMEKIREVDGCQEEWSERLKEYLLKNYPAGSGKKIKREELLKLI
ncbi:immunity 6 family protein [Thermoactinomyces vulgaris]|uniref:Imm6 family immunity protein n=1 Tax=Thermoactinomyces vulgaris TaxID=2026 RepID=UPI001E4DE268|nr:Imm6 family immunity protein [Thermoactinomyces vulgaris]MCF6133990.1 immunity 6 family protein [Thermoactinomyces vulgaris]